MQGYVEIEPVTKQLVPDKLVVLLVIVVSLVVIVACIAVCILVFSAWIIASSILLHLLFCGVIPGMVGLFYAVEGQKLHERVVSGIGTLQEIGVQLARSTLYITVAGDIGEASVKAPMVSQKARTEAQTLFMRGVTACRSIEIQVRIERRSICLHVHSGTKCSASIGRCAHTSLYLKVFYA